LQRKFRASFDENRIQLLGPLQEKELINEMLEADVFIHPSHIDNSPNSLCEAMLLGMPVIATFAGGIPSIVENKKEGLLVQDGDPYALAGAIMELKKNRSYANELRVNARDKALRRHDPKRIVNDLINIYSSII
jgi:glycosyltransferase involved in cell wall biosynthesis